MVLILNALYEESGVGASMSSTEPESFSTIEKTKKGKKNENYFANTMACFSLAQFSKSREKLLLNTLAGFYTVRLANNVTRTL